MKQVNLLILLFFFPTSIFCQPQNSFECNIPALLYFPIDTFKCIKSANETDNLISLYYNDTTSGDESSEFTFKSKSEKIFYKNERGSMLHISDYTKQKGTLIYFDTNKKINKIILVDSCKYKEMRYHEKTGELIYIFNCDYSKRNECYSYGFENNNIISETSYLPFAFSGIEDYKKVNYFYWDIKAIPYKYYEYDEKHNILVEYSYDSYGFTKSK